MANTERDGAAAYAKVIAKAWRDPSFKAKLLADPQAVLEEAGMAVPAGVTVKVVENTATHFHVVLPPKPTGQLSDEALDTVAAGAVPIPGKCGWWSAGASYG
jgi:Nitrile hydratase, alpha chain